MEPVTWHPLCTDVALVQGGGKRNNWVNTEQCIGLTVQYRQSA